MRSANLIGQERSSDRIDFTTELHLWYCAMLLWREMDNLQLLTLYLTPTPIFSGRKAKINLHTTSKLTVVMPISCLLQSIQFPSAQKKTFLNICWRGGGGGGSIYYTLIFWPPSPINKRMSTMEKYCLWYEKFRQMKLSWHCTPLSKYRSWILVGGVNILYHNILTPPPPTTF